MRKFKRASLLKVFALSSLFIALTGNAQKEVFSGYYVSLKGDTTTGTFSSYKQWSNSPNKASFIPTNSNSAVELSPANTQSFTVLNYDTYVAYTGHRIKNTTSIINALALQPGDPVVIQDEITTFLQVVAVTGNITTLQYNDRFRTNFFIQEKGQPIKELHYYVYRSYDGVKQEKIYLQQLNSLFSAEIQRENAFDALQQVAYTEESLTKFLSKLQPRTITAIRPKRKAASFAVMAGVSANTLNVNIDKSDKLSGFNTSINPVFGVGYYLPIKRNFNKFFFFPQVKFYAFENIQEGKTIDGFNSTRTFKAKVVTPTVNFGLNIFNATKLKFYIAGGTGSALLLNNKQEIKWINPMGREITETYNEENIALTLNVQTGLLLKSRVLIWSGLNLPTRVTTHYNYQGNHTSIQFGAGYLF